MEGKKSLCAPQHPHIPTAPLPPSPRPSASSHFQSLQPGLGLPGGQQSVSYVLHPVIHHAWHLGKPPPFKCLSFARSRLAPSGCRAKFQDFCQTSHLGIYPPCPPPFPVTRQESVEPSHSPCSGRWQSPTPTRSLLGLERLQLLTQPHQATFSGFWFALEMKHLPSRVA